MRTFRIHSANCAVHSGDPSGPLVCNYMSLWPCSTYVQFAKQGRCYSPCTPGTRCSVFFNDTLILSEPQFPFPQRYRPTLFQVARDLHRCTSSCLLRTFRQTGKDPPTARREQFGKQGSDQGPWTLVLRASQSFVFGEFNERVILVAAGRKREQFHCAGGLFKQSFIGTEARVFHDILSRGS